jgi:hypothetical protein
MSTHDPMHELSSRKITGAVERDPAFNAMFSDDRAIPNTWGNLASQLVEQGFIEPTSQAVCDYLGITPEDLQNPRLSIQNIGDVERVHSRLTRRWQEEYEAAEPAYGADGYVEHLQEAVIGWHVDDGPEQAVGMWQRVSQLNEEAKAISRQAREAGKSRDERQKLTADLDMEYDLESQKAQAYQSGTVVSLDVFVATMLGHEPSQPAAHTKQEVLQAISGMIDDCIMAHYNVELLPTATLEKVMIGAYEIGYVLDRLEAITMGRAHDYSEQRWAEISHLFWAPSYKDHPVFAGTEK